MTLVTREPHGANCDRFRRPTQVCRKSGGLPLASARRVGTAGCRPGVSIYRISQPGDAPKDRGTSLNTVNNKVREVSGIHGGRAVIDRALQRS